MELSAGSMREQITLQTEARVADGGGGYAQSFTTSYKVYASVKALSGNEQYQQGQITDTQQYEFIIRYRSDKTVTAKNRILWGTRVFQIKSVINDMERNKYLVITAAEGVAT